MKELEFKPAAAFRLDDASPFTDYSGYGRSGTITGTESHGISLTSTAAYSQRAGGTRVATFTIPNFLIQGFEGKDSTLTGTVYPIGDTAMVIKKADGGVQIDLSRSSAHVLLKFGDNSVVEDTISIERNEKVDFALVYTERSITLWLNGEQAIPLEIIEEQRVKPFFSTSNDVTIGSTAGEGLVNNLCFFYRALTGDEIKSLHKCNNRHVPEDVPSSFNGQTVKVSTEVRKPSMTVRWDTADEWNAGAMQQSVVDKDQLQAQRESDVTLEGEWARAITFTSPISLSAFQSAYLIWGGKNFTIEVSLDAATWVSPTYGRNISLITTGFDPNNKTLFVRVNFPAGVDEAYVDYIEFRAFTGTDASNHIDERTITYTNPAQALDEYDPNNLNDFWGVDMSGTGRLTIGADVNASLKTLEIWAKIKGVGTTSMSTNISAPDTFYVNGELSGTILYDQWIVLHYTYNAGVSADFWIQGDIAIGRIACYPTALSGSQISNIVRAYTGYPTQQFTGSGTVTLAESATPATIYDHAWANRVANA